MASPPRKRAKTAPSHEQQKDEPAGILSDFRQFSSELTAQQDRHERLVKLSRDLTVLGKRSIFTLQRIQLDSEESRSKVVAEAHEKLNGAGGELLSRIACELHGQPADLYSRAFSPGIQEYIEARTLLHYIENRSLISRCACNTLVNSSIEGHRREKEQAPVCAFSIPINDYVLGVADVGGELMRLAVNNASGGNRDAPFQICGFIRSLYEELVLLENVFQGKGLHQKVNTMRDTLTKLESACYALKIRGAEVPGRMIGDLFQSKGGANRTEET